jgi:hypothetical protein
MPAAKPLRRAAGTAVERRPRRRSRERTQSWLGKSGQVSALYRWSFCRLPLWGAIFGMGSD